MNFVKEFFICEDPKRRIMNIASFGTLFAANFLERNYDIWTIQELLGHKDAKIKMICTHALNRGSKGDKSPVDDL